MKIVITPAAWKKFVPKCPANYTAALFELMPELDAAGILDEELTVCHFFGQVWAETGGFNTLRESLTYTTTKRLRKVWPSRFGHKSDAELKPLLRNPKLLGETVYGVNSGRKPEDLGNKIIGDGYDFRGGGWFQTTGRGNVEKMATKLGMKLPVSPDILNDPVITLRFAILEWTEKNCGKYAKENDIIAVSKAINTGSAKSKVKPVGMDNRKAGFARAWGLWGDKGKPDAVVADVGSKATTTATLIATGAAIAAPRAADQVISAAPDVVTSLPIPSAPDPTAILGWQAFADAIKGAIMFGTENYVLLLSIFVASAIYWNWPKIKAWADQYAHSRAIKASIVAIVVSLAVTALMAPRVDHGAEKDVKTAVAKPAAKKKVR